MSLYLPPKLETYLYQHTFFLFPLSTCAMGLPSSFLRYFIPLHQPTPLTSLTLPLEGFLLINIQTSSSSTTLKKKKKFLTLNSLPVTVKLLERVVYICSLSFLISHSHSNSLCSGFCTHHSTETALSKVTSDFIVKFLSLLPIHH